MPVKTKEIKGKNTEKSTAKVAKKVTTKKSVAKKNINSKKEAVTQVASPKGKTVVTEKNTTSKKKATTNSKVSTPKKKATAKKGSASSKKTATTKMMTTTKKASASKKKTVTAKKVSTSKKATNKKETTSRKKSARNTVTVKAKTTRKAKKLVEVVEYYDLPYRYNETIVKILYQTPNTLFVYWDIADSDREKYIKQYGENFFNITRPVLIVHNDTMNYSFEVPINDFANSWYLHVNDSKCNYRIELGRRPNYYNQEDLKEIEENIKTDYIYVSSSNEIESPNDHVLFNTNKNNTIKFRNIKNHVEKSISLYDIIKHLPAMEKGQDIPYISEELLKNLYAGIYENEDISLFERLTNPSSAGNPSSGSMSSRFI